MQAETPVKEMKTKIRNAISEPWVAAGVQQQHKNIAFITFQWKRFLSVLPRCLRLQKGGLF